MIAARAHCTRTEGQFGLELAETRFNARAPACAPPPCRAAPGAGGAGQFHRAGRCAHGMGEDFEERVRAGDESLSVQPQPQTLQQRRHVAGDGAALFGVDTTQPIVSTRSRYSSSPNGTPWAKRPVASNGIGGASGRAANACSGSRLGMSGVLGAATAGPFTGTNAWPCTLSSSALPSTPVSGQVGFAQRNPTCKLHSVESTSGCAALT